MPLPDSYPQLIQQAASFERAGQFDEAFDIYQRVATRLARLSAATFEKRKDLRDFLIVASTTANRLGRIHDRFDDAIELAGTLTAIPDLNAASFLLRAETLADANRCDEAQETLRAAGMEAGRAPNERLGFANEALWNGWAELALDILGEAKMDDEGHADVAVELWFMRFRALTKLDRLDEAEQAWRSARDADPDDPPPSDELIEMFMTRGETGKALLYADAETNMFARGYLRGLVAALQGKMDWARDEWWRVAREPYDVEKAGLADWMECAARLDDTEKVHKAVNDALEKFPGSPRLALYQAIAFAKEGKLEDARRLARAIAVAHEQGKIRRVRFVIEADRWLIEQAIHDPEARNVITEALFAPVSEEDVEALAQETPEELQLPGLEMGDELIEEILDEAAAGVAPADTATEE